MYSRRSIIAGALLVAPPLVTGMESSPLPDPTRPPLLHQVAVRRLADSNPEQFTLTAIKISADDRKAIVNDRLVREGEHVGESLVVEIIPGAVILDYLGQRKRLRLLPYNVRNASENRSTEE